MTTELKPCSLCGWEATSVEPNGIFPAYVVCENPDCWFTAWGYNTVDEAIAAWNRRQTPPPEVQND